MPIDDLFPDDFSSDFSFFRKISSETNPFPKKDYAEPKNTDNFVSMEKIGIIFSKN